MKILMLGWEFPPFISGGLGTACCGLVKAMDRLGMEITFVLPKSSETYYTSHVKMLGAKNFAEGEKISGFKNVRFRTIASLLRPYVSSGTFAQKYEHFKGVRSHSGAEHLMYGGDIYSEVHRYAEKVAEIAATEEFDVIHAHDWMTYPAGMEAARLSRKPLVVHVHSTEFDRSGEYGNRMVCDIERQGLFAADKVIAVSNFTKNMITRHYNVPGEKIEVVYNGVEHNYGDVPQSSQDKSDKIILFLGRITMQKGPEYFLAAAKKVLEVINNVKFVMAGTGDMMHRMVGLAAQLGIGHKVLFTGFLRGEEVNRIYRMADLYVMPSVSEPFGIAPLEALREGVPVLISKQSGISETLINALKVDFWDINEMANKMVAVIKRPPLHRTLCRNGFSEVHKFRWENSAAKINKIYEKLLTAV